MNRVRLVEVAKAAGVSVGAASDALAGKNRIPEETRRRVREAAERLGYVPNRVARALRSGHLPLIGLVIPSLRRSAEFIAYRAYWGAAIGAATLAAAERGYGLVLLPGLRAREIPDLPLAAIVVVDVAADDDDELEAALGMGIPVFSEGAPGDPRIAVRFDPGYERHVEMAMDHLSGLGAQRIAMIAPAVDSIFGHEVLRAHSAWCARSGHPSLVATFDFTAEGMAAAVDRALAENPDALYFVYAVGPEIEVLVRGHGRTIGEDLRVLVQDEDTDGEFARRGLSTLTFPLDGFAAEALTALADVVEGLVEAPVTVVRSFQIIDRASTVGPQLPERSSTSA